MTDRSKEYDLDNPEDVAAREDYLSAAEMAAQLIDEFEGMQLDTVPALGGALTQLIAHLIHISDDVPFAMSLLSTCILDAALETELEEKPELEVKRELH